MRAQRRLFVAASCVVSALVCPGPAIAAAPWSTPQTIGGNCCSEQQLVALPGGGVALAGDTGIALVAPPGAKPSFTQSVGFTGEFSPTGALGPLALAGGGQTVITMIATGPETIAALGTIGTAETLSAESGGAGQTLTPTPTLHLPQAFVVASTNDAILVRRCTDDCEGPSDLAVVRRHGAVWAAPRAVTQPGTEVRGGALTTMPDGTIAVAYERNHAIFVRRLALSGRLSPAQRVGSGVQSEISVASIGGHRLVVAWAWQRVDEGDAESGFTAAVACSSGIGHFTGRSHVLASIPVTGEGAYVQGPGLSLGQDAGREVTLAWTGFENNRFDVQTTGLSTRCATAPQTIPLPGSDAVLGGLAVAPSGQATIALLAGLYGSEPPPASVSEAALGIYAAERPRGAAAFAAPVEVSSADENNVEPVVAIDSTSGLNVLAWRNASTSIEYATAP